MSVSRKVPLWTWFRNNHMLTEHLFICHFVRSLLNSHRTRVAAGPGRRQEAQSFGYFKIHGFQYYNNFQITSAIALDDLKFRKQFSWNFRIALQSPSSPPPKADTRHLPGRRSIPTIRCGVHPIPRSQWRRKESAQRTAWPPWISRGSVEKSVRKEFQIRKGRIPQSIPVAWNSLKTKRHLYHCMSYHCNQQFCLSTGVDWHFDKFFTCASRAMSHSVFVEKVAHPKSTCAINTAFCITGFVHKSTHTGSLKDRQMYARTFSWAKMKACVDPWWLRRT